MIIEGFWLCMRSIISEEHPSKESPRLDGERFRFVLGGVPRGDYERLIKSMTFEDFAERHRLRTKKQEDGEFIVQGKFGHIYNHHDGRLGVCIINEEHPSEKSSRWARGRKRLERAGMEIHLDGDGEGLALFDPENDEQAKAAITVIQAFRRRRLPPEQQLAAVERLRECRLRNSAAASAKSVTQTVRTSTRIENTPTSEALHGSVRRFLSQDDPNHGRADSKPFLDRLRAFFSGTVSKELPSRQGKARPSARWKCKDRARRREGRQAYRTNPESPGPYNDE